jgi:hypothetical protein
MPRRFSSWQFSGLSGTYEKKLNELYAADAGIEDA